MNAETIAVDTAKLLGTGNVQIVLAIGLVFAALVGVWLGRTLYKELKLCNEQMLDLATKKIDSDNKLASALTGLERVVDTALRGLAK